MSERVNVGIKHPVSVTVQDVPAIDGRADDVLVSFIAANGDQVSVLASRERLAEALQRTPGPSQSEIARRMYVRGEIEVEDLERLL